MSLPDNIFLIGYRGTGKTTVGRLLAAHLHWDFVDADVLLEDHYQQTIRDIFASEGESGFREKETAILHFICQTTKQVIATGGGVILRAENRELLCASGRVVWLTAKPDVLWKRINMDASTEQRRPNLTKGGLEEIEDLLAQRTPLYQECAEFHFPTDELSADELVEQILAVPDFRNGSQSHQE